MLVTHEEGERATARRANVIWAAYKPCPHGGVHGGDGIHGTRGSRGSAVDDHPRRYDAAKTCAANGSSCFLRLTTFLSS